jgi:hypothetical protein
MDRRIISTIPKRRPRTRYVLWIEVSAYTVCFLGGVPVRTWAVSKDPKNTPRRIMEVNAHKITTEKRVVTHGWPRKRN